MCTETFNCWSVGLSLLTLVALVATVCIYYRQLRAMQTTLLMVQQYRDKTRKLLKRTIRECLENFGPNVIQIRDARNPPSAGNDNAHIQFSPTSLSEIGHYYDLFLDVVVPNLLILDLPEGSRTIKFFNEYKKNLEAIKAKGHLFRGTVDKLIAMAEDAIRELSDESPLKSGTE